ncbi:DUF4395 domain-containing protein [Paenibacillus mucilaginosus]|uniref:DUF4395 domain-containing protein n=1 Tax=Paenibacillus mucilaginosus TaxID=61624 RepID=UPI001EEF85DB|nr:DUF4395 domain-containing protein [Paenibacillus mucilaginosus]MCG7218229.1 DUF4395 domain-containing protein [Paenibacillus mucilaginosus]WDM30601.1 DUF4395 domain-containing protein [Paenibacillus mucilaginosus]WFA18783.1 DUF4395 domain-containing protein [Paenibacillus mucilaginosus]
MKDIPIPYVRANQAGMVLFVLLAVVFQLPVLIVALWAIQVLGLWQGVRANLIVQLAAPLLRQRIAGAPTESRELQRFNNSIVVGLLTLSLISFWISPGGWIGYLFAGMVALAALAAICGFCVGCFLYYQLKRQRR